MAMARSGSCRGSDRRRRLLTDELSHNSQWPAYQPWESDSLAPPKTTHYGDAPFLDEPLRVIDLIPCNRFKLFLIFCACIGAVAGVELAYQWMPAGAASGSAIWALFDLSLKTSLANWLSVLSLLAAAATACIVYCVRRHRIDDYQGRYRVWTWAACTWFLMAADQATMVRAAFRETMVSLTGSRLVGDGDVWWAIFYAMLLGGVGSRLLIDMRPNWMAMTSLVLAGIGWTAAAVMQLGWLPLEPGKQQIMIQVGAGMACHVFVFAAMGLHARHVIFDAQGLLGDEEPEEPVKERHILDSPSLTEDVGVSADGSTWVKIDPPHSLPPAASRRTANTNSPPVVTAAAIDAGWSPLQRKLTKDERKALKAKLLGERQKRK